MSTSGLLQSLKRLPDDESVLRGWLIVLHHINIHESDQKLLLHVVQIFVI